MNDNGFRVVHTCPLGTGGITSMVLNICECMDRDKINFDYLVYRNQKEYNEHRAIALGGRKLVADNEGGKGALMHFGAKFINTYKVLKKSNNAILHINASTPYDTLIGISAKLAGVKKVVVHSHNANNSNKSAKWLLTNKICRMIMSAYTDCYLTCSTEAAEFMFPKKIYAQKKYEYIKNGIDVNKFRFNPDTRNQIREQLGVKDGLVIGNVGRFFKQKNHAFLIEVFKKISDKLPDSKLLLIGVGELQEEIIDQAKRLGVYENVIFWGPADNVNELMQAMDVFVMTSFHEGLPVVGIEAQATGLPCVFSDTITKEVNITDNGHFISLNESPIVWAEEIIKTAISVKDRATGADLVSAAGYDINSTTQKLFDMYIDLLK